MSEGERASRGCFGRALGDGTKREQLTRGRSKVASHRRRRGTGQCGLCWSEVQRVGPLSSTRRAWCSSVTDQRCDETSEDEVPLSRSCGSVWCKRVSRWRHPTSVQNISLMIPSSRRPRHSGMPSRRSVTRWKAEAIRASTRVPPWGIPLGLGTLHVPDQVHVEGHRWNDFKTGIKTKHLQADWLCFVYPYFLDFFISG